MSKSVKVSEPVDASGSVKAAVAADHHVLDLMGTVFGQARASLLEVDWDGLRPSHFRVLEAVSAGSALTVEIAAALGMTKQGAGHHVATLVEKGCLEQSDDDTDRRAKRLRLTARGRAVLRRVHRRIADIEDDWSAEVGSADYRTFRRVLARIAGSDSAG